MQGDCPSLTPSSSQAGSMGCGKYRMCWFVCVFSLRPSGPGRSWRDFGQNRYLTFRRCAGGWWLPPCTSRFPGLFSKNNVLRQLALRPLLGKWFHCPEGGIVCWMNVDSALAVTRTKTKSLVLPCLRLFRRHPDVSILHFVLWSVPCIYSTALLVVNPFVNSSLLAKVSLAAVLLS